MLSSASAVRCCTFPPYAAAFVYFGKYASENPDGVHGTDLEAAAAGHAVPLIDNRIVTGFSVWDTGLIGHSVSSPVNDCYGDIINNMRGGFCDFVTDRYGKYGRQKVHTYQLIDNIFQQGSLALTKALKDC